MATTIGSIVVDLLARTGSFETDMNRSAKLAEKRAKEIDKAVSAAADKVKLALGAAGAAAIYFGKQLIDGMDALNDVADATGASIEKISALEGVAMRTGTTMDTVSGAIVKFNSALKEADGKNGVSRALKAIGLDADYLKSLDPADALHRVSVALAGFADDGNKARLVQELFGKSVKEVAPFLKDLAEQTELVGTVTGAQAANAEAFNKQIFAMRTAATEAARSLMSDLLPAMTQFLQNARDISKLRGWGLIVKDAAKDMVGLGKMTGDNGADIKQFMRERDRLQKDLDFATRKGFATRGIEDSLAENSEFLAVLRAKQRNEVANAAIGQDYGDAVSRRMDKTPSVADIGGGTPKKGASDKSGAQIAAEQLARELDQIENAANAVKNANDNREKILEAQRSASLISDAEYYNEKRKLMAEADQAEIKAIEEQIKRLQAEQSKLSGKDAEKNIHKIEDARAKLAKTEGLAATNLTVLNINAKKSTDDLASSMEEARRAAESLLATTERGFAIELSGMGLGTKSRDLASAINQIEQTYEQKRQDLERDNRNGKFTNRKDDYDRELALIEEFQKKSIDSYKRHYAMRADLEKSAALGASEAAANYFAETQNAYKMTEEAVTSAFKGMEDALVEFVKTGKLDFKSLVDSILSDIARITIRQQITGPLAGMLNRALSGGDSLDKLLDSNNAFGTAPAGGGGGFDLSGAVSGAMKWVGGLFSGFKFAEGGNPPVDMASLVGERGPEMFVPRTAGTIIPNHVLRGEGGGRSGGDTHNNYFNVGDVATVAMLKQALATTQRQSAAVLERTRRYGGATA